MQEMVYDDAKWVQRLRKMGCWNDVEARKRAESIKQPTTPGRRQSTVDRNLVNGKGRPEVLFDLGSPTVAQRRQTTLLSPIRPQQPASDGFDVAELASSKAVSSPSLPIDTEAVLSILKSVKSVRGQARREYGKIYKMLGPYYINLTSVSNPMESRIFRDFAAPEQQAQLLANLRSFSESDFSPASASRETRIKTTTDLFDTAALLEFRKGYEYKDIQGRMRQYAKVMHILNGGKSSVELFLHDNNLVAQKVNLGSASDCVDYSLGSGQLSLERVQGYFERLGTAFRQEIAIIQAVFPEPKEVTIQMIEVVGKDILSPFLAELFDDARNRGTSMYLRTISGTLAATKQFVEESALPKDADDETLARCNDVLRDIFEPHLDIYLAEELSFFRSKADVEVEKWDRALSEQAASTESFLMSNVNRQADKKDFMSSFKKVVMMPVNILPSFSGQSSNKTAVKAIANGDAPSSRSSTPNPFGPGAATPTLPGEAPTNELAAKAAVMTTKLENIRSLFSIEVALNLVHAAKSSLERGAQFISLGGEAGDSARRQCSAIFVLLLHSVGDRHVKAGFDKAIDHLSHYNPREGSTDNADSTASPVQVAALVTFLELVNVGDLIQQMLDVFYESELVRLRISNRDDFLDVNVKEKKKFEAMLDERVAAGLSKGIDVLIDEVEYVCATTQQATDFYPELNVTSTNGSKSTPVVMDFSGKPTATASRVIALVSHHTSMLTGATEKTLLDVFTTEVGLRLFGALTKHIKRQRISTSGALPLLSDLSAYASFVAGFKNNDLTSYFVALREVAQIYLIGGESERDVNEMATIISDSERYRGVFTVEEVVEFAERRSDWLTVKGRVEGRVKGEGCCLM
jgi:recyclin-1